MAKKPSGTNTAQMPAQPNGSIASHGSTTSKSSRSSRRRSNRRSYPAWILDKGAKLLVWYGLLTVLFRCPSSQKDLLDSSPQVCRGYLQARDYITPYAQPYYD